MTLLKLFTVLAAVLILFPWVRRRIVRMVGTTAAMLGGAALLFLVVVMLAHPW